MLLDPAHGVDVELPLEFAHDYDSHFVIAYSHKTGQWTIEDISLNSDDDWVFDNETSEWVGWNHLSEAARETDQTALSLLNGALEALNGQA